MKEKLRRFMTGRYGVDQLAKFLLGVMLVLAVVSIFAKSWAISLLIWILVIYCYYRMFSRNISKRYAENQKYLMLTATLRRKFSNMRYRANQRKVYKYLRCPKCRQEVRVPRGKGKICITCPKCRTEFFTKS